MKKNNLNIILVFLLILVIFIIIIFSNLFIFKNHNSKLEDAFNNLLAPNAGASLEEIFNSDEIEKISSDGSDYEKGILNILKGFDILLKNLNSESYNNNSDNQKNKSSFGDNPSEFFEEALILLDDEKNSDLKADAYYGLSKYYLYIGNDEKSEENFKKAYSLYDESEDKQKNNLVNIIANRTLDLSLADKFPETPDLIIEAIELAKINNNIYVSDLYCYLATYYWLNEERILATTYKFKALETVSDEERPLANAFILLDIAQDNIEAENYEEAIKYIYEAFNYMEKKLDENSYECIADYFLGYINLYECYSKTNNLDNAEYALDTAETYLYKLKKDENKTSNDSNILFLFSKADFLCRREDYETAQALLNECREKYNNLSDGFLFADFDLSLMELQGNIFYGSKNYEEALKYHLQLLEKAESDGKKFLLDRYNSYVYNDYKMLGSLEEADTYAQKIIQIKETAKHEKDIQYSKFLVNEFQDEKKTAKINTLEQKQKYAYIIISVFSLFLIFTIIYVIIIKRKNLEIQKLNKLFKNLSTTDGLTEISNRRSLDDYLNENWNLFKNQNISVGAVMIDIDHFKKYNDNYGHVKGDIVLKEVAQTIKNSCRKEDFPARYGGEEFSIIIPAVTKKEMDIITQRILENIRKLKIPHEYSDTADIITLSIGYTFSKQIGNITSEEFIKKADSALYEAKKKRNTSFYIEF